MSVGNEGKKDATHSGELKLSTAPLTTTVQNANDDENRNGIVMCLWYYEVLLRNGKRQVKDVMMEKPIKGQRKCTF